MRFRAWSRPSSNHDDPENRPAWATGSTRACCRWASPVCWCSRGVTPPCKACPGSWADPVTPRTRAGHRPVRQPLEKENTMSSPATVSASELQDPMRVHRCSWTSGPPWSSASVTFRAPSTPPGSHREAHPADRAATTPRHRGDLPLRSPLNARRGAVDLGGYDERNRPDRRDRRMARRRTRGAHRSRTLGSGTPGPTDRRVPGTRRDSDEHRGAACHMVLRRRRCTTASGG